MTKQEYHQVVKYITAVKIRIEEEDAALENKINACLCLLKQGANPAAQIEMDRRKFRRFTELEQERRTLCEGYIREKTGFKEDMLHIYTNAEYQNLKGESWARFMLEQTGCHEPK